MLTEYLGTCIKKKKKKKKNPAGEKDKVHISSVIIDKVNYALQTFQDTLIHFALGLLVNFTIIN